jgi:uncharacterized membrane protein YoaK (UPF0700 family)
MHWPGIEKRSQMFALNSKATSTTDGAALVASSLGMAWLPSVLSVVAGSTDIIGFLGLGGLFTAHITGNLAILAAHVASSGRAEVAQIVSVPVFIGAVGLTRLLAVGLESIGLATLRPLLLLQFLLLAGFFALCVVAGPHMDTTATNAILAGMIGVSAMAVQNALVQISLVTPPTAVMTGNVTRFTMDVAVILLGRDPDAAAKARTRAKPTAQAIAGFAVGCGLGAVCEVTIGLWSLALPAGLALLALAIVLPPVTSLEERRLSLHKKTD